jgi:hypothetical protein
MTQPAEPTPPISAPAAGLEPPPQAPPAPAKEKGLLGTLAAPPGGAATALWLGIVVMILSFLLKQILVDLSLGGTASLLETGRLHAEMSVEIAEVDEALDSIDGEIESLEADVPKPPTDPSQFDAFTEKQKQHEEKLDKLRKKRAEKDEELEPKRRQIRESYRPKLRSADRDASRGTASSLGKLQSTLGLKLVLDLLKLVGAVLVILSGLTICFDPRQTTGAKAYAAVLGGIAFLSTVLGGLYALLG